MDLFAMESQWLAPLETFAPQACMRGNDTPQDLCTLMLCFALICDDWKDSLFALRALELVKPQQPQTRNRTRGLFRGLHQHVTKSLLAILPELLNLIRENDELFEEKTLS